MFPIYFKNEDFKEPDDQSFYFIVAENGLFLFKKMDLYTACVKAAGISWLLPHSESLRLNIPRIPSRLVGICMGFFYEVYHRYRSEAIILLFFSPLAGFRIGIPKQYVYRGTILHSSCSLRYENFPTPEGYFRLGTWHSHGNLKAEHSFVDAMDEEKEDGLHLVCGDLDISKPSFSLSFMVNGRRFLLEKEDVFEGYEEPIPPPERWLKKIECVGNYSYPVLHIASKGVESHKNEDKSERPEQD